MPITLPLKYSPANHPQINDLRDSHLRLDQDRRWYGQLKGNHGRPLKLNRAPLAMALLDDRNNAAPGDSEIGDIGTKNEKLCLRATKPAQFHLSPTTASS
jgi:hypothetical protein